MTVSERYAKVLAWFQANMGDAESELNFRNPYELLVAVMLSAQCTDKRVNMVTPAFFERFPDAFALSEGTFDEVLTLVKSISYPNSKAELKTGLCWMSSCDIVIVLRRFSRAVSILRSIAVSA